MTQQPAIIAAKPHDAERGYGVLMRAFEDDPPNRWLFPERERYLRFFPAFARALSGPALAQGTAFVTSDYAAVAVWLGPGARPDEAALGRLIEEGVSAEKQADMAAMVEQMIRYHPHEPHWYLPFIGVEPSRQNQGLGGALLRAQLAVCDAARLPAYLESSNPRNQPLYARHGFEPVAEINLGDCPPVVPMLRRARAA